MTCYVFRFPFSASMKIWLQYHEVCIDFSHIPYNLLFANYSITERCNFWTNDSGK
jgi:hypothetical protein